MGGRAAKQAPPDASPDASSGSSSGSGSREHAAESLGAEISERLTLSMQDARVICRRPSALNGDILVEELLDEPSGNVGTTVRRMRFCSNLALEQTEVRLFRWTRMVAKPKRAGGKDAANGKNQARARGSGRGQGGKGGNGAAGAGARANPFGALEGVGDEDEPAARQQAGSGSEDEEEVEMLVADSNYLPYECMQGMCLSFALLPRARVEAVLEEPLSVCITGLAGGMLPRFIRHNFPRAVVDTVEIDKAVADIAVEMLGLKLDERLRVHVADGVDFLAAAGDESFDINIIDVNASDDDKTLEAPPPAFITEEFVRNLQRTTKLGGLAVVNVLCQSAQLTEEIFTRFRDVFYGRICYLLDERVDADENVIVFILNQEDAAWPHNTAELVARVRVLERKIPAFTAFGLGERLRRDLKISTSH
eukprot:Tamp_18011.p1 GENE.Tamp_18011~~Tamp_18011.p1  ORF type:complete len:430 (+),score=109.91 Tamp_18011:26-1291(+)